MFFFSRSDAYRLRNRRQLVPMIAHVIVMILMVRGFAHWVCRPTIAAYVSGSIHGMKVVEADMSASRICSLIANQMRGICFCFFM